MCMHKRGQDCKLCELDFYEDTLLRRLVEVTAVMTSALARVRNQRIKLEQAERKGIVMYEGSIPSSDPLNDD